MKELSLPYRVGKKQGRAILDAKGLTVVVFEKGFEHVAEAFCQYINQRCDRANWEYYRNTRPNVFIQQLGRGKRTQGQLEFVPDKEAQALKALDDEMHNIAFYGQPTIPDKPWKNER